MTFELNQIIRKNILQLVPYASARSEFGGRADVFLDANENSLGSPLGNGYHRYPDPLQKELKAAIGRIKGISPESIFLGNGSDEPIDLLIRATCDPGKDQIILLPPTYGMYEVAAHINDVAIQEVALDADFRVNAGAILAAVNEHTKLIFICSPNNPTANLADPAAIKTLLKSFKGLVIVDEAYIDFAAESSMLSVLDEYPNLVVLQTLSKAWGLAGLRLGMAFASKDIISVLNNIKPPYNINAATQQLALEALGQEAAVARNIRVIKTQRGILAEQLAVLPFVEQVFPSDANFLLVRVRAANEIYRYLLEQGIVVRNRSGILLCENCLRITVGTETENSRLLAALHNYTR